MEGAQQVRKCVECNKETEHKVLRDMGIMTRYRTITSIWLSCTECGRLVHEEKEVENKDVQIMD